MKARRKFLIFCCAFFAVGLFLVFSGNIYGNFYRGNIQKESERASVLFKQKKYKEAGDIYQELIEKWKKRDDNKFFFALMNLGNENKKKFQTLKALSAACYYYQAMEVMESENGSLEVSKEIIKTAKQNYDKIDFSLLDIEQQIMIFDAKAAINVQKGIIELLEKGKDGLKSAVDLFESAVNYYVRALDAYQDLQLLQQKEIEKTIYRVRENLEFVTRVTKNMDKQESEDQGEGEGNSDALGDLLAESQSGGEEASQIGLGDLLEMMEKGEVDNSQGEKEQKMKLIPMGSDDGVGKDEETPEHKRN